MHRSQVVVMDLRGFDKSNRGCQYEIEALARITNGTEVTFLVDDTTDMPGLEELLTQAFRGEPNYRVRNIVATRSGRWWQELVDGLLERRAAVRSV